MKIINLETGDYKKFSNNSIQWIQYINFDEVKREFLSFQKAKNKFILEKSDVELTKNKIEIIDFDNLTKIEIKNKIIKKFIFNTIKENEIEFPSLINYREMQLQANEDKGIRLLNKKLNYGLDGLEVKLELSDLYIENFIENINIVNKDDDELKMWFVNLMILEYCDKEVVIIMDNRINLKIEKWLKSYENTTNAIFLINNENQIKNFTKRIQYVVPNQGIEEFPTEDIEEYSYALKQNTLNTLNFQLEKIKKIALEMKNLEQNILFYEENNLHFSENNQ